MLPKLTKEKRKELLNAAAAVFAVALLYLIFHLTGIGCPIHFLTGISCPGCGMTRALFAFICLRFSDAFYYHPLIYAMPFALLAYLLRRRIPKRVQRILLFTFIALFVTIYLVRMCDPTNDVVVFQPEQGFILRTIKFFFT